uniref:Putative inhibitor-2 n=1 Tax=Corethrella appendiculata TaxID=1370023 RepID=U5EVK1_9DIPT
MSYSSDSPDAKKPCKGILKSSSSFDKHAAATVEYHSRHRKSAKFDELNVLQTYHPPDKDYGFDKVDEPKTPFNFVEELNDVDQLDAELLAEKLKVAASSQSDRNRGSVSDEDDDDSEEEVEETEEQKQKRKEFERRRKAHYNEYEAVKLARKLIEEDEEEDDDTDDIRNVSSSQIEPSPDNQMDVEDDNEGDGGGQNDDDDDDLLETNVVVVNKESTSKVKKTVADEV